MSKLALCGGEPTVTLKAPGWPQVGEAEIEAVTAALRRSGDDWEVLCSAAGGGPTGEFETAFAEFMGSPYAMCTAGGGPALHIAVMAAGVEAGDEVICSPYTWGQSVSCVLQQCAVPVFADIDPETYTLDPASVEACITEHTRAIVVVHLYGHPAEMAALSELADDYGLALIEDCAQATGATIGGQRVGTFGHFGCFSIGDGKQLIGGEGGVLLCRDERGYELANAFGQHPMRQGRTVRDPALQRYTDSLIYTYRIHPLAAVIAQTMLPRLDSMNAERRANHDRLSAGLADLPGIAPVAVADGCEHVYHQYSPTFVPDEVEGVPRELYSRAVAAEGAPLSMGYVRQPIYLRPTFQDRHYFYGRGLPWSMAYRRVEYRPGDCPVAEHRCAEVELSSGGGPAWLGDQSALIDQILDAFGKVAEHLDELRKLAAAEDPPPG